MKKVFGLVMVGFLFFVGCSPTGQQDSLDTEEINQEEQVNGKIEVVIGNLNVPWSIERHNDIFYVTERPGTIAKIENGELIRQDVELSKELSTGSEDGLMGFVLSPNFEKSSIAYAYYTYEDNRGQFNRVVTLRLEDNIWTEENVLLDNILGNSWHDGGRLEIGPDETLYITVGDAYERSISQDSTSLAGKILRMNLDGSIPGDNPFPNSYVYSLGHRNPQGITWLPDGTLYASEHGNEANDEINVIEAGQNYGWPLIEGTEEEDGLVPPQFTSGSSSTWAPSGMDNHNGKLYVAALRGSAVLEFDLETGQYYEVISGIGRIRDVRIEDNYLYFISNNKDGRGTPRENDDKLYRISLSELERR
ncbi:sorbosone dehydrogenase family protein [Bacillus suaedae]